MATNLSAHVSIATLRAMLDTKKISAVELAEHYLAIAERALALNCYLHIDRGLTRIQAKRADERIAPLPLGRLSAA